MFSKCFFLYLLHVLPAAWFIECILRRVVHIGVISKDFDVIKIECYTITIISYKFL